MEDRATTWLLVRVMATATIVGIALSLSQPLLSLVLEQSGVERGLIGLNAAAGGLGALLVAPFVGRLVAWSAVRSMAAGVIGCAAVFLILPLQVELWTWFGLRILFAAGLALLFIMSESAVNALVPEAIRGRVIGLYGTLFSVGYIVGPAIIAAVGSRGMAPFVVGAAILALGLLPLIGAGAVDTALRDGTGGHAVALDPWRRLRTAPLPFVAAALFTALEGSHFAFLPLFALSRGFGEGEAALMLTVFIGGNMLLQYPAGWLADRFGRGRVLAATGGVAVGLHLLIEPSLAAGWPVWPVLVILGGAVGSIYSLGLGLLGQSFPPTELAAANTLFIVMIQVGILLGPLATGAAMQAGGAGAFSLLLAGVALMLPLSAYALHRPTLPDRVP